jgi:ceramide glucosyltransferase
MPHAVGVVLWGLAAVGMLVHAAQVVFLLFLRAPKRVDGFTPSLSVLKPLCGADDLLEENLERFAQLAYLGEYELLLGVKDERDAAYPLAKAAEARHPDRVRVVLQRGEPGHNPKVNQLITLEKAARHEVLIVSDSNVRVGPEYLVEVAAALRDPEVGCVSHALAGYGERTLGSAMDNLHQAQIVGAGVLMAKRCCGKSLVIGKSMALWRKDLEQLGGFSAFKDVLAEDHVIGNEVEERLQKRVVILERPVYNVSVQRSTADFVKRYLRWSVIQRTAVRPTTYLAQLLLNPAPLALLGTLALPSAPWRALLAVALAKVLLDVATASLMGATFQPLWLWASLPKDFLIGACWVHGLFCRTVNWRGNRLRVLDGSRLVPMEVGAQAEAPTGLAAERFLRRREV